MVPVDHDDLDVVGQGHRLHGEVMAVDERGVPLDARGDRQLIHDAARDTASSVLCSTTQLGERQRCSLEPERECDRNFERRARRKAGADRHLRVDGAGEAVGGAELGDHASDVTSPDRLGGVGIVDAQWHRRQVGLLC